MSLITRLLSQFLNVSHLLSISQLGEYKYYRLQDCPKISRRYDVSPNKRLFQDHMTKLLNLHPNMLCQTSIYVFIKPTQVLVRLLLSKRILSARASVKWWSTPLPVATSACRTAISAMLNSRISFINSCLKIGLRVGTRLIWPEIGVFNTHSCLPSQCVIHMRVFR